MGVRWFISSRVRESAGPLRMRNGMLRPSVGVEGLEDDSSATSFSAAGITNSLSEKACIDEIGRAKFGRVPATPFGSLGNSVLDVWASIVSPFELAALLVYPGTGLRILKGYAIGPS